MTSERNDIYTRVTDEIIAAIEGGAGRAGIPWHSTGARLFEPLNAVSQRPYRGINVVILWAVARHRQYASPLWATYKQWRDLGAQVQKGEKATEIVLWKQTGGMEEESDEETETRRPKLFARGFSVFNIAQVTGYAPEPPPELSESERCERAETFFRSLDMKLCHEGNQPHYDIDADRVVMPEFRRFKRAAYYYSVLAHETIHWTGAPKRLARKLGERFGSHSYAAEELIAELGAAFLAARFGTFGESKQQNAAYLSSWLRLFKSDKRAMFTAASKAQQAVDWLAEQAARNTLAA